MRVIIYTNNTCTLYLTLLVQCTASIIAMYEIKAFTVSNIGCFSILLQRLVTNLRTVDYQRP